MAIWLFRARKTCRTRARLCRIEAGIPRENAQPSGPLPVAQGARNFIVEPGNRPVRASRPITGTHRSASGGHESRKCEIARGDERQSVAMISTRSGKISRRLAKPLDSARDVFRPGLALGEQGIGQASGRVPCHLLRRDHHRAPDTSRWRAVSSASFQDGHGLPSEISALDLHSCLLSERPGNPPRCREDHIHVHLVHPLPLDARSTTTSQPISRFRALT